MASLIAILKDSVTPPGNVIQAGRVPLPIILGIRPPTTDREQTAAFNSLMGTMAMVRMFAGLNEVQKRKARGQDEPFAINNPQDVGQAFADGAEATFKALNEGLDPFYTASSGTAETTDTAMTRAELHGLILNTIFSGLPDSNRSFLNQMEGVLKHFAEDLQHHEVDASATQPNVEQCVVVNYVKVTDLTGDQSVLIVEPHTRTVLIKVRADCWNNALRKPDMWKRNEKIEFAMESVVTDMKLEGNKYQAAKPKWEKVFQLIAGQAEDVKDIVDHGGIEAFGQKTSRLYQRT
jgi:hypothetical protein